MQEPGSVGATTNISGSNSNGGVGGLIIPTSPPGSGGAPSAANAAQFESSKREATRLERQLEDKIAKYQELSQRYTTFCHSHNNSNSNAWNRMETGGNNNSSNNKEEFQKLNHEEETLKHDIQRSLRNLQEYVENRLAPLADTSHQKHLVKRYREIWLDSSQDFEKSCSIIQRYKDRIELFAHSQPSHDEDDDPEAAGMDALLRERNHINNSINATSSILDQAATIRQDLRQQGMSLTNIRGTIGGIVSTVPGLNSLVDKIKRKRSRDDYILSGVIASCILFTLWYLFG